MFNQAGLRLAVAHGVQRLRVLAGLQEGVSVGKVTLVMLCRQVLPPAYTHNKVCPQPACCQCSRIASGLLQQQESYLISQP